MDDVALGDNSLQDLDTSPDIAAVGDDLFDLVEGDAALGVFFAVTIFGGWFATDDFSFDSETLQDGHCWDVSPHGHGRIHPKLYPGKKLNLMMKMNQADFF